MKKLELLSDVMVTYNDSQSTSTTVFMHGIIEEIYKNLTTDYTTIIYKYVDSNGNVHTHGRYIVTETEMDALYETVKNDLPDIDVVGHAEHEITKYYHGFRVIMADKFPELDVSSITIQEPIPSSPSI